MKRFRLAAGLAALSVCPAPASAKRAIQFEDLMKVQRISDPQVSPDGHWVAYVETSVDLAANKKASHIWVVPAEGGPGKQLTWGEGSDSRPRWSPDGDRLAFISTRGGKSQMWTLSMGGGEAHPLTSISTEADGVTWAAKSDMLIFTSQVYPDCADDACNHARLEEAEHSKIKARLITSLLYRHWTDWRDGKYTHLFAVSAGGCTPRGLTPGAYDSPTFFLGAPDGYAISPDGTEVTITSNRSTPPSSAAWTTNNDLYVIPSGGGAAKEITETNPGSDASPQYSPNGRYIAYTSKARNGYESDLFRLRVYDRETGQVKNLTEGFDQWVEAFAWAPDSDTIYFLAPDHAENPVFKTSISHPKVEKVLDGYNAELAVAPDGKSLIVGRTTLTMPEEIFRASLADGSLVQLTHANVGLLSELDMNPGESVTTPGALGAEVQSLLLKPPGFDPAKKYPAIFLI